MKGTASGAGTGKRFVEGRIVGCEHRSLRIQMVDRDSIQPKIVNQHVTIVRRYGSAMGVRSGLTLRVRPVAGVVERGNGWAEGAVFQYAKGCRAPPVIIGHEGGLAGKVDGDFAGASAGGGDRVDRLQFGGIALDGKRRHGTCLASAILIHLIYGVEVPAIRRQGKKARVDRGSRQSL